MLTLTSIYRSIDRFFFRKDRNAEFIVFFRVGIGMVVLLHFCAVILDFEMLFTSHSIVPQDIMTVFNPDWILTFPKIVHFTGSVGISESTTIFGAKMMYIGFCIAIITGFYARWSAFFLMLLQVSLMRGSGFFIYGVDFFTTMSLFYLVLFPSDNYFSLRNYLKRRADQPVNFTPVKRLFQIHISIAYFFSGFDKILGFNWHNGEAIWKAINLPYANRDFVFDFTFLAEHSWILVTIGWATIFIEMFYPIFIWWPRSRKFWLISTIFMHLGIALILNLYYFSAVMIVWNLANFYFEGEEKKSIKFDRQPEVQII